MESQIVKADDILDSGVGKRLAYVDLRHGLGEAPEAVPLAVITGSTQGPTVWINASLHGDEYLGPATLGRLLGDVEPNAVRGRLILTPTLNPGGFRAMQRADPTDLVDLNRVWSADPGTPTTNRIAAWAETVLLDRSDFVIDLHSGGNRFFQQPFAVYPRVGTRSDAESAALAKACGLPWLWAHEGSLLERGLVTAAARKGRPAILLELAGEGKAERAWIDEMAAAVRGALRHVGLLAGNPRYRPSYLVFEGFTVLRNHEEGLWSRAAEPGESVRKGDPLGRVLDLFGRERELVTSPRDAAVAGICSYGYVPSEDYLVELAHDFHEEGPPS